MRRTCPGLPHIYPFLRRQSGGKRNASSTPEPVGWRRKSSILDPPALLHSHYHTDRRPIQGQSQAGLTIGRALDVVLATNPTSRRDLRSRARLERQPTELRQASARPGRDDQARSLFVVETDTEPRVRDGYMSPSTCGHPRAQLANAERWVCRTKALANDRACTRVTPPNFHGKEGGGRRFESVRGSAKAPLTGLLRSDGLASCRTCGGVEPVVGAVRRRTSQCCCSIRQHPALISRALGTNRGSGQWLPVPDSGIWRCRCTENTAARPVIRAAAQLRPRRVHPGQRGGRRARRVRRDAADVDGDLRLRNGLPA
jgi:hypothetical protein